MYSGLLNVILMFLWLIIASISISYILYFPIKNFILLSFKKKKNFNENKENEIKIIWNTNTKKQIFR